MLDTASQIRRIVARDGLEIRLAASDRPLDRQRNRHTGHRERVPRRRPALEQDVGVQPRDECLDLLAEPRLVADRASLVEPADEVALETVSLEQSSVVARLQVEARKRHVGGLRDPRCRLDVGGSVIERVCVGQLGRRQNEPRVASAREQQSVAAIRPESISNGRNEPVDEQVDERLDGVVLGPVGRLPVPFGRRSAAGLERRDRGRGELLDAREGRPQPATLLRRRYAARYTDSKPVSTAGCSASAWIDVEKRTGPSSTYR